MPPSPPESVAGQAPSAVVMVRPHHFRPNPSTLADNSFQKAGFPGQSSVALQEVTQVAQTLQDHGVEVHIFEDLGLETPDSVFPNNWFTTHPDGTVVLYPMYAPNRRLERRPDVLNLLALKYRVQRVIDLATDVPPGTALEGTGAMVLDHIAHVAYVCRSRRADPLLLERFCDSLAMRPCYSMLWTGASRFITPTF